MTELDHGCHRSWLVRSPPPWFQPAWLRRGLQLRLLPCWVLAGGMLLTLLSCIGQQRVFTLEHERVERVLADDISSAIKSRFTTDRAILDSVVGLFDASDEVSASAFSRFYQALTLRNPNLEGIQGVGFASLETSSQLPALVQRIRRQGQPDFQVRPEGVRSLAAPIVFLQPEDWRNQRARGFDMFSETTRRQAMQQAATTGETVLSGPLRLQQETIDSPQVGALLYTPIYAETGAFRSSRDRWRRLRGWAFSPLRMGDLISSALSMVSHFDHGAATVVVYDGMREGPQHLLFDSRGLSPAANRSLRHPTWVAISLSGRQWLIGVELDQGQINPLGWSSELLLSALLGISLSALAALLTGRLVENHQSLSQSLEREAQAARERALAAAVFDTSPVGIVVTDPNGMILRVNQAFTQISGYSELEARGHKANLLRSGRHDKSFYQQMWQAIVQRGYWSGEIWNRHRNGQIRRHELNITAVLDANEQILNFVGLLRDVTERYSQDRKMRHLATHDSLTGLANRSLFMEELRRCLALAHRKGQGVGLLFLDLNGFKAVNDLHGHSSGDALLQTVAKRLRQQVRASDLLCRHGGDEFVLLIPEAPDCGQLQSIAAKLLESLQAPDPGLPDGVVIRASIGVARCPDHASNADALLDAADNAMYAAKQHAGETLAIAVAKTPPDGPMAQPADRARCAAAASAGGDPSGESPSALPVETDAPTGE